MEFELLTARRELGKQALPVGEQSVGAIVNVTEKFAGCASHLVAYNADVNDRVELLWRQLVEYPMTIASRLLATRPKCRVDEIYFAGISTVRRV